MSPFRNNSTAAARSVEMTVFTLAMSQPELRRTVFCERLLIFDEACHPMWRESQPPKVRHFLHPHLQWPGFQQECRLAFALSTTANQVPGVSIELAHQEQATKGWLQLPQPNVPPRLRPR